jgi:hypothetical protein
MSLDVILIRNYHISYDSGKTLEKREEEVYSANITHNLGEMAEKAGIYEALWRPHRLKPDYSIDSKDYKAEWEFEDKTTTYAVEIIDVLEKGLEDLQSRPKYFEQFNSPNKWGMYEHFVPFVEKYLKACKENPETIISISR